MDEEKQLLHEQDLLDDDFDYKSPNRSRLDHLLDRLTTFIGSLKNGGLLVPARKVRHLPYALTPSFIRTLVYKEDLDLPRLGPTTWMDGFRGLAAIAVFNFHFFFAFTLSTHLGYISSDVSSMWQLSIFRLFYDGITCVIIFFTVSGYVCTTKALHLMTSNQHDKLISSISTSVFRRFFRLYLPVICITFISTCAAYIGFFEPLRPMITQPGYFPGYFGEPQLPQLQSFTLQLKFWASELLAMMNVFDTNYHYANHDPHLWTIPIEFRMSMHVYIALIGLALCRPYVRIAWLCILSTLYVYWGRWEAPLFFLGAAMAQLDVLRNRRQSSSASSSRSSSPERYLPTTTSSSSLTSMSSLSSSTTSYSSASLDILKRILRPLLYLTALHLMTYPIKNHDSPAPGYTFITNRIPLSSDMEKYPKSLGVLLLFYLLTTTISSITSIWHRILTTNFARYFAKHMFAFYLVQGNILHTVGYGIPHFLWGDTTWQQEAALAQARGQTYSRWALVGGMFDKETTFGFQAALGIGWIVSFLLCIWAADVFQREIIGRCVLVTRLLEKRCFKDNISSQQGVESKGDWS